MTTQSAKTPTPGPWNEGYTNSQGYQMIGTLNRVVCMVAVDARARDGVNDYEGEANARLITMAPDMKALLIELKRAFYVDGTAKALKPVMAQIKPLLDKIDL